MSVESHYTDGKFRSIRTTKILTDAYVAGTVVENTGKFNHASLLVAFTIGSATSLELIVEVSRDGTTYYKQQVEGVSGGETTFQNNNYHTIQTGNKILSVDIDPWFNYIKVSFKMTGDATNSDCLAYMILNNK